MIATVKQICIKGFEITARNGDHWEAKQGKEYTTTPPSDEKEMVTVFSNYWVLVPKDHFVLVENEAATG